MATPNLVPRSDGEGSLGVANKRWAEAFFSGRLTARGQTVSLKYFVSDEATRYSMSGLSESTRPEDGDLVFQYYPPSLFVVIDDTNLGIASGYQQVVALSDLASKMDTTSGTGYYPTLYYSGVEIAPSGSGFVVDGTNSGNILFSVIDGAFTFNTDVILDNRSSGEVLVLNENNIVTTIGVTSGELYHLLGASGNIQDQLDILSTGVFTYPGGSDLSIQYKDGTTFGGNQYFRYNRTGYFGFSPDILRGPFDIKMPTGLVGHTGLFYVTGVAGDGFGSGTYSYAVYPYTTYLGVNYYASGSVVQAATLYLTGDADIQLSWSPQSGASGYRVSGISGSSTVYETTSSTGFIDSGLSNVSGDMTYFARGANLYIDNLSNLFLSGLMYINSFRVLTVNDLPSYSGTGVTFYDDTYVVKTTGDQSISGNKTFYGKTLYESGIGIRTTVLRGPFDIGYASGTVDAPTDLSINSTYNYIYQLWDTTGALTFVIYAFTSDGDSRIYSSGLSGDLSLTGSYNWFKVDLAWTGVAGASGYKIVFGGDETNGRYGDYYIETTGTTLEYGTTGDSLTYESPMIIGPTTISPFDIYVDYSGDLRTVKDIYCRYLYADNLTGIGATTGWVDANYYPRSNPSGYVTGVDTGNFATTGWIYTNYLPRSETGIFITTGDTGNFGGGTGTASFPEGGYSGQPLKRVADGSGTEWGDILNPFDGGSGTGVTIDFLSGQLQKIVITGSGCSIGTANRANSRFASTKIHTNEACSLSFESGWTWLGPNYFSGLSLASGTNGVLSLTCYDTGVTDVVAIFRYEGDTNEDVTFSVTGTYVVTNLNADMVDGHHASDFAGGYNNRSIVLCAGYTPTASGADTAEVMLPYDYDGSGVLEWDISRVSLRVQNSGGAPSFYLEKSTGVGLFDGFTLATVTLATGAYEGYTTGITGKVSSGDKIRYNVLETGSASYWTLNVEISR